MNIIKILLIIIAAIILLVISAVSIFVVTFDVNEYKSELSQLVKQKTGRDLVFQGDIGLTVYPALGMKLGSMSFSNAAGFGEKPMLSVNNASVSVDVLSLLSFNPQIAELILDGLSINLQKDKQGKTNWDDLVTVQQEKPVDDKDTVEVEVESDSETKLDLQGVFAGLAITNANLMWSDAMAGAEYQAHIVSLLTGEIIPEKAFPFQLNMQVNSANEFNSTIEFKADVLLLDNKLTLSSVLLDVGASGQLIPVDQLLLKLVADVEYSLASKQLAVSGFSVNIDTSGGALQNSSTSLAGEIGFDLEQQHLTIAVLDIQSALAGEAVPNGKMKAAISASQLALQLNKNSVVLDNLVLALNENEFKGFVKVLDYTQPTVEFELKSDTFNVDKLMGTVEKTEPVETVEEVPAEDVQIELPMALLRDLKLDGKLEVATLITQGLTINNVLIKMDANKGRVNLDPIKMDLYDGVYNGFVKINVQGDKPVYSISKKISSFQVGKFLQDFMGDDMVSGDANIDVDLTTSGDWLSELKSNLNGDLGILVKDGALKGFNLRHKIETARAKLRREKEPALIERKTDFSALSLSGLIQNGVFSSDDLDMQAPLIRVGGKGSADLAKETVDYLVNAKLVTTSKGQQGGTADELSGVSIPVAITGPWGSPEIDVQLDEMLKAKLNAEKAKVREAVAKQKAQLMEKLDAEKAKLKASQQKETEAKKLQLEKKRELAEAEQKAKLQAEKEKKQAELDAKKEAGKEKAKKKLEDKLKKLF